MEQKQTISVDKKNILRYQPTVREGLSSKMVEERIQCGLVHHDTDVPTKTIRQIVQGNLFTLFNILNFTLGFFVLLVGSYKNLLFLGVVICNILISTLQEIKAKKTVDELSLISESKVEVVRDGKRVLISKNEIVLDDVIHFALGRQVVVDSIVIDGECLVNEAFITGENNPIRKKKGDLLLSGSFIVSGSVYGKCEHVGEDNYTSAISKDAKYLKKVNSVLMNSLNTIVRVLSYIVVPLGILLFCSQLKIDGNTFRNAVVNTVAALIGMIPDGLVLLTSTVLAVSIIRLGKYHVLVRELYCIETLARVDTLCLDKTGTITEGSMELVSVLPQKGYLKEEVESILVDICCNSEDETPTMMALKQRYCKKSSHHFQKIVPFSSDTKYASFIDEDCSYLLGAPEFILGHQRSMIDLQQVQKDYRVLLLAVEKNGKKKEVAYLLIQDKIRKEAKDTLAYFYKQDVDIKVISGDNPVTVSQIAKRVGLHDYENYIDLSTVSETDDLVDICEKYTIFGRVTPSQKKKLVLALKAKGHTVAMTGDGVNDVLALKEADCSIAMASGSDAARNVSQLVLLESNFDAMPRVVEEGRRTINNIQRSASLFLVKTIYATLLAVTFLFLAIPYPFIPIQLSLTNMVIIGIPSFVLALQKNTDRVQGNFLTNVLAKSFPTALSIFTEVILVLIVGYLFALTQSEISTLCVLLVAISGFHLLYQLCQPFNWYRGTLFFGMIAILLFEIIFLHDLFSLAVFDGLLWMLFLCLAIVSFYILTFYRYLFEKGQAWFQKRKI